MDHQSIRATTQVLGITASLISTGAFFITSYLFISPLLSLPINESTRIFDHLYHQGAGVQVPLSIGSSLSFAVAAYMSSDQKLPLGAASAVNLSSMVFTFLVMLGGINRLLEIGHMDGSQIQKVQKATVNSLLIAWKQQNYVRACLNFVGGALGLYAIVLG